MASSSLKYRGDLGEISLPEVLQSIARLGVPGLLSVTRGDVSKQVFILDRCVVHAASSDLSDSLGVHLQRSGQLSDEEFAATMLARDRSRKRLGVLLLERALLTPAAIRRAICEQIEAIVWSLFEWRQGEVTFHLGSFEEVDMIRIQLPLGRVILEGIERMPDAREVVERLGSRETVYEASYSFEQLIELGLDGDAHRLLQRVDGRRSVLELCSDGERPAAGNARLLYALRVLDLVRPLPGPKPAGPIRIRFNTGGDQFD